VTRWLTLTLTVVALGGASVAVSYPVTHAATRPAAKPTPTSSPSPASPTPSEVLAATAPASGLATATPPVPNAAAVTATVEKLTKAPDLGGRLLARVIDVATGTVLYDKHGDTQGTPASISKLLTASAVLSVYPPSHRFTTTAVAGANGAVVLVGGGDPTLTAAAPGDEPDYADAGRLSDIAKQIKAAGVSPTEIVVDGSLFPGPSVNPLWDPGDMGTSYGAPITALMVDGGRALPADFARTASPDIAAGQALARLLGQPGLPVEEGTAPAGAKQLGSVASAPLATIVGQMLVNSDNILADVLSHDVAVGDSRPASFAGAVAATREVLATKGVDVGTGMHDGSGLADADKVSPAALTAVLRLIATDTTGPTAAVTGLPIGGLSGTLANRYRPGTVGAPALGDVRAKTGTLTIVTSLAGFVHDKDGQLLAFALISDDVPPGVTATRAAERAQDAIATALSQCGCS
jgi:D-alanyl-D-alanine carboxypeptidase/D-alanyl-D-alanine-endopeptidase (penicillin-binding protein 4)